MDSGAELDDHPAAEPRYRAVADAQHMGDHGLALALEQQPHQLALPRIELADHLGDHTARRLVVLATERRHLHGQPALQAGRGRILERRKRRHAAGIAPNAAGDVDRPVVGEPLQIRAAVIGRGAAGRIEGGHRRLAHRRPRQPAEMVEDQGERVVEGGRIANPTLGEHPADDQRRDRLRRMYEVFESGVAAGGLPGTQQRLEIDGVAIRHGERPRLYRIVLCHEQHPWRLRQPAGSMPQPHRVLSMHHVTARLVRLRQGLSPT